MDIMPTDLDDIAVNSWNGMPNYLCPHCPYDDLDLERLRKHIENHHVPKQAEVMEPKESRIIQVDSWGYTK
jgi:hypothetical protein